MEPSWFWSIRSSVDFAHNLFWLAEFGNQVIKRRRWWFYLRAMEMRLNQEDQIRRRPRSWWHQGEHSSPPMVPIWLHTNMPSCLWVTIINTYCLEPHFDGFQLLLCSITFFDSVSIPPSHVEFCIVYFDPTLRNMLFDLKHELFVCVCVQWS
jgi:hypothetical protein